MYNSILLKSTTTMLLFFKNLIRVIGPVLTTLFVIIPIIIIISRGINDIPQEDPCCTQPCLVKGSCHNEKNLGLLLPMTEDNKNYADQLKKDVEAVRQYNIKKIHTTMLNTIENLKSNCVSSLTPEYLDFLKIDISIFDSEIALRALNKELAGIHEDCYREKARFVNPSS